MTSPGRSLFGIIKRRIEGILRKKFTMQNASRSGRIFSCRFYRHLVKEVSAVEGADFFERRDGGTSLLAKNLDEVGFHSAEWEPEVLATADEKAREIIRKIRMGSYEMSGKPPMYSEDFAGICQDFVFEKADPPGLETTVGELSW